MTYFSAQSRQLEQWDFRNREPVADQPQFEPPPRDQKMDADEIKQYEENDNTFQHMTAIANSCENDGNEFITGFDYAWDEPVHPVPSMNKADVALWLEGQIEAKLEKDAAVTAGQLNLPMFGDKEYNWRCWMRNRSMWHTRYSAPSGSGSLEARTMSLSGSLFVVGWHWQECHYQDDCHSNEEAVQHQ